MFVLSGLFVTVNFNVSKTLFLLPLGMKCEIIKVLYEGFYRMNQTHDTCTQADKLPLIEPDSCIYVVEG